MRSYTPMYSHLDLAAVSSYSNVPEYRNKVRSSLIVVQKLPQPTTTLVRKFISGSLRFTSQGFFIDGDYYSRVVSWVKSAEEIEFTHFLGSERQSPPNPDYVEEQHLHPSHVFRFAGAVGLPAIVKVTPPHKNSQSQTDDSCKNESPAPDSGVGESTDSVTDTDALKDTELSPSLTSEIQKLPHFSPLKAWYRDKIFGSFPNLPGAIRSEQSASKEGKRSELFRSVDLLCATLEKTNIDAQEASHGHKDSGPTDSGSKQNSQNCGGSRSTQSSSKGNQSTTGSCNSAPNRKQKKRSNKDNSDNEGRGRSYKKTKPDGPDSGNGFKCRIFEFTGAQRRCNGEYFPTFESMREHVLRIHIKSNQCGYCWKRFGRNSERTRHEDSICKKNGLVKREPGGSTNDVPPYVINIGKNISTSTRVDALDQVLFPKGIKQYDILDNTDVNRPIPQGNQGPEQPSTPVTSQLPEASGASERPLGHAEYPIGNPSGIEELHSQFYDDHTRALEGRYNWSEEPSATQDNEMLLNFDLLKSSDLGPFGTLSQPSGQKDGLLEELDLFSESPEASNSQPIEEIIDQINAAPDPLFAQTLASQLLARFPQNVKDALTAVIARSQMITPPIDPMLDDSSLLQTDFVQMVASGDDEIPIPPEDVPDSAYVSTKTKTETYKDEVGWMNFNIPFDPSNSSKGKNL